MKLVAPLILSTAVAALVTVGGLPASAAAGQTAVTFTLTSGSLAVTPASGAAFTDAPAGTGTISGSLGAVAVADNRGVTVAWTVSATSTTFTSLDANPSVSTAVNYSSGAVATTGTATVGAGGQTMLGSTSATVVSASSVSGSNTATWTPTLEVTMPGAALAGDYNGTVTTSVA